MHPAKASAFLFVKLMIEQDTHKEATEKFTRFLKSKKLRKTPERFAILDKILEMQIHFGVEDVYRALETDAYHVSLATVYNTIDLLTECGLLHKHQFDSHQAQYEVSAGNHFHLICTQCGKIKEMKNDEFIRQLTMRRYTAFQPTYLSANLYGLCSACIRHNKKKKSKQEKITKNIKV